MSDPSDVSVPRRTGSVALGALWVLGVALILAAVAAIGWAVSRLNAGVGFGSGDSSAALTQATYLTAPAVLSGGVGCIGLALAVTALRSVFGSEQARSASDPAPAMGGRELLDPPEPARGGQSDPSSVTSRPLDPEAFKRPRSASDPRP